MAIRMPKHIAPYADRDLDCQAALEEIFRRVLTMAVQSGWTKTETAAALQELAFAQLSAEEENDRTDLSAAVVEQTKH